MEALSALLALCAGNSQVTSEFPTQRPVTWSFDVFFDLRLNKRLSKQLWGWWFETLSRPLWRHCNVINQSLNSQKASYISSSRASYGVSILRDLGKTDFVIMALHCSWPSIQLICFLFVSHQSDKQFLTLSYSKRAILKYDLETFKGKVMGEVKAKVT